MNAGLSMKKKMHLAAAKNLRLPAQDEQKKATQGAYNLQNSLQVITDTQSDMKVSPRISPNPEPVTVLKSPTQENLMSQADRLVDYDHKKGVRQMDAQSAGNATELSVAEGSAAVEPTVKESNKNT